MKEDLNLKVHWYAFSYIGNDTATGEQCHSVTYTGYNKKMVTNKAIQDNKVNAGVSEDSCLLSVSYLGFMSKAEFIGEIND